MTVKKTAFKSIDSLLKELTQGLNAAEKKVMAVGPRGGATVTALIVEYQRRLKLLADRCANRRGWATQHSIFPGWTDSASWSKKSAATLDAFHAAARARIEPFCSKLVVGSPALTQQAQTMLDERADRIKEKLQIELETKHDEALGATASRTISAFWKFILPAITAIGGSFLTWLVSHLSK
jgi:hypothetical protein